MEKNLPPDIVQPIMDLAIAVVGYLVRMLQVFLTKKSQKNATGPN